MGQNDGGPFGLFLGIQGGTLMLLKRRQRGTALVVVVVLVAFVAVSTGVFMSSIHGLRKVECEQRRRTRCVQIARAGVERAIWELTRDAAFRDGSGEVSAGAYRVTVQNVEGDSDHRAVVSTASFDDGLGRPISMAVRARLKIAEPIEIVQWSGAEHAEAEGGDPGVE